MKVLTELLKWSKDRPSWQRDALRRLVVRGALSDLDIAELATLCKKESVGEADLEFVPLSEEHLPEASAESMTVNLASIEEVHAVNALAPQGKLEFGESPGLCVIYGANGSGKSGFVRILKQVCRARHRGAQVLPNILARTGPPGESSARINYEVDGEERTTSWVKDEHSRSSPDLSLVYVFDADCATVHVREQNELAFIPQGMDLLEKLVGVCQKIRSLLQQEIDEKEKAKVPEASRADVLDAVAVTGLGSLCADTEVENLRALAQLTPEEERRYKELGDSLDKDPEKLMARLREREKRLMTLKTLLQRAEQSLSVESIQQLKESVEEALEYERAATVAAQAAFKDAPLPKVGESVWQRLWESAREYSDAAYPEEAFPYIGADARCLLCQQKLSSEAGRRFERFEAFVRESTRNRAQETWLQVEATVDRLRSLQLTNKMHSELRGLDEDLFKEVHEFVVVARHLRFTILRAIRNRQWNELTVSLPHIEEDALSGLIAKAQRRRVEVQSSIDPDDRTRLQSEYDRLGARMLLREVEDALVREINRLKEVEKLEKAKETTITNAITMLGTRLAEEIVTDTLSEQFTAELDKLNFSTLKVDLVSAGGKYGNITHRIRLVDAPEVPVGDVASEGEHRTIALAAFLAELFTANAKSSIVLDDPVSSLDHRHRRFVARRIVEEATERQMIVFTHDVVFVLMLKEYGEQLEVDTNYTYLDRSASGPGLVCEGVPWWAMNINDRIIHLNKMCTKARAEYDVNNENYRSQAQQVYGLLREAWERGVEEVLLNNAVQRFDRRIQTRKLRPLPDITEDDVIQIDRAMSKCSTYLPGHDEAAAIADPMPAPDELEADVRQLREWAREMRRDRGRSG